MNRFTKLAVAAVAGIAALAAPLSEANARPLHRDEAIALGIFGVAAGALLLGASNQHRHNQIYQEPAHDGYPDQGYDQDYNAYPAAPVYHQRRVIRYTRQIEPWTNNWYAYCSDRYRSFNAQTGTYRGNDGRNHFCTAG